MDNNKNILQHLVRSIYDIQDLRIQIGGRIVAYYQQKLDKEIDAKELFKKLKAEHKRLVSETLATEEEREDDLITNRIERYLATSFIELLSNEKSLFRELDKYMEEHFNIYREWMKPIKGVGPATAGVILANIDISKAKYVSSLWKYCGMDVAPDGRGRGRYKEHLVDCVYIDKDGKEQTKKGLGYNPQIKSMLLGVTATSMIKLNSPYREFYDNYKHRITSHPKHKEKSPLHIHNMSMRYMMKMFLRDLYNEWRKMEGLEVHPDYHEAKLGHVHTQKPKAS